MTRTTFCLAAACLLLASGTVYSQSKGEAAALSLKLKELKEANADFKEALRKAKQGARGDFEKMIRTVRNNPKLSATVKADKVSELKQAQKEFEDSEGPRILGLAIEVFQKH